MADWETWETIIEHTIRQMNGGHRVRASDITFKGSRGFVLVGSKKWGGAVATREQYENNATSYAHLYEDGTVRRYGMPIGTRRDIKFVNSRATVL